MPRTVNEAAYALRRDVFLDAAQRLLQTKGYDRMSIQDVLDETGASKGAFYHYFDSKEELLEGVLDRVSAAIEGQVSPVVSDPTLGAIDKLNELLAAIGRWKVARRDLLIALSRGWLADVNAVVRQKLRPRILEWFGPHLATIVEQGQREGVISTTHPEEAGRVFVTLLQDCNDEIGELFLAYTDGTVEWDTVERTVAAYTEALERILGIAAGSLVVVDPAVLGQWFDPNDASD
jgi:AcrR family transcriptional regulator